MTDGPNDNGSNKDSKNGREESFAELFEASLEQPPTARIEVGQEVQGKVLQIGAEWTFLDVGAKGEALIASKELLGADGTPTVKAGDTVEARVVRHDREGIILSRVLTGGAGGHRALEEAHQMELPVEGVVKAVIKGGLEVEVAGVRTFCPASQIDIRYVEDLGEFVGQRLTFRVAEYRDNGRSVVLSRKSLLSEEAERLAEETRTKVSVGAVLPGTVSSIREFGAFIDLGGIDGLLHVSEISHGRVERVSDRLTVGQQLEVQVIKQEGDRISLSLKALADDPWDEVVERFAEGTRHHGVVTRVQPFGAFVELMPGVDGLLHVSTLDDPRITDARRVFEQGKELEVEVVSVDPGRQRIGLAPADRHRAAPADLTPGSTVVGKVERVERYGVFVRLPATSGEGRPPRGLIPREEIHGAREDLRRAFPIGSEVRVKVIDPDDKGRIRLSTRALHDAEERAQAAEYLDGRKSSSGFGTLGDLLKEKLKDKPKK